MNPAQHLSGKRRWDTDREWQACQERILLYLRLLRIPGVEALEAALEALLRARGEVERGNGPPAAAAMQALRKVLQERRIAPALPPGQENRFGKICPWPELSEKAGVPRDARSMPLLNRGSMMPDRL
jgi:hypothetical protein